MTTLVHIAILTFAAFLFSCNETNNTTVKGITKNDTTIKKITTQTLENPRDLVRNYNGENNRLFVFVGHKISVDPLPYKQGSMDVGFKAKFLVVEKVFGNFSHDTIEFAAYDHYGTPLFANFNDVLLFVSADSGTYYHQKYQYNDVYKTKDGHWAGPYPYVDYEHELNKTTKIKPTKIDFAQPVYYQLTKITEQGDTLRRSLPKPYFKTVGDSALAVYGNYVNELFILKRDGVLTAREIFRNAKLIE